MGANTATAHETLEQTAVRCGIELEYTDAWGKNSPRGRRYFARNSERAGLTGTVGISIGVGCAGRRNVGEASTRAGVFTRYGEARNPVGKRRSRTSLVLASGAARGRAGREYEAISSACAAPGLSSPATPLCDAAGLKLIGDARFIVCPRKARTIDQRVAGVALSLYGLRSARNWGIGDATDLNVVVKAFADEGAAFVALNPLHALPNRYPYNISPYLPECSLYRNYLYLDVERCTGIFRCRRGSSGNRGAACDGIRRI